MVDVVKILQDLSYKVCSIVLLICCPFGLLILVLDMSTIYTSELVAVL